jgi:hypothetical protein
VYAAVGFWVFSYFGRYAQALWARLLEPVAFAFAAKKRKRTKFCAALATAMVVFYSATMQTKLRNQESGSPPDDVGANVWFMVMSTSTVGFGDVYLASAGNDVWTLVCGTIVVLFGLALVAFGVEIYVRMASGSLTSKNLLQLSGMLAGEVDEGQWERSGGGGGGGGGGNGAGIAAYDEQQAAHPVAAAALEAAL